MSTKNDAEKPAAPAAPARAEIKTAEQWAEEKATPAWLLAAAKAFHRWPIGKELTEADFTRSLDEAANVQIGG